MAVAGQDSKQFENAFLSPCIHRKGFIPNLFSSFPRPILYRVPPRTYGELCFCTCSSWIRCHTLQANSRAYYIPLIACRHFRGANTAKCLHRLSCRSWNLQWLWAETGGHRRISKENKLVARGKGYFFFSFLFPV